MEKPKEHTVRYVERTKKERIKMSVDIPFIIIVVTLSLYGFHSLTSYLDSLIKCTSKYVCSVVQFGNLFIVLLSIFLVWFILVILVACFSKYKVIKEVDNGKGRRKETGKRKDK